MVTSMLIFGTIGIFVSGMDIPSSVTAFLRSGVGALFIGAAMLIMKKKPDLPAIKKNAPYLLLSGAALGFNWILLFEAYNYTSVAVATLCYYMAPVFVTVLSPFILKERLTAKKLFFTGAAVIGAVLISDITGKSGSPVGIALGLSAAVLYCFIVILNRLMKGMDAIDTTICQLFISAAVMGGYLLITRPAIPTPVSAKTILLTVTVCIVHTGIAYLLFFGSASKLTAQRSALLSYIDPVTAVILSATLLGEKMSISQAVGAVLILGSTLAASLEKEEK